MNTHPATTRAFLIGQMSYMRRHGFDVFAVSAPGPELDDLAEAEGVTIETVPMEREIHPWRDVVAMLQMCRLLRRLRPEIVYVGTPKASLLGMVASAWVGVPVRIYLVRGLRLETTRGLKRLILRTVESITSACAHLVLCESASLRDVYHRLKLSSPDRTRVLGPGMLNGLDLDRFARSSFSERDREDLRRHLGIPAGVPVIGFVGRLVRDKGMVELAEAFETVLKTVPDAHLLLVGDFESGDPIPEEVAERVKQHSQIVMAGRVPDAAPYYQLMDVLAFPSYREGFPVTPMEAAAAEVPTVGFRSTGVVDAVVDGETGTLLPQGDAAGLAQALLAYLHDPQLRRAHGQAAHDRVARDFQPEHRWHQLLVLYEQMLADRGLPLPRPGSRDSARAAAGNQA